MTNSQSTEITASGAAPSAALIRWLAVACWRQQPGPLLAAVFAIALGVALGLGISLVNASALNEFDSAISRINGEAQYQLTGALEQIDDQLLSVLEQDSAVLAASPIISIDVPIAPSGNEIPDSIALIALDIFRAAKVAPALLPRADTSLARGSENPVFSDQAVFLSAAAKRKYQAEVGDTLPLLVNGRIVELTVSGDVPGLDNQTVLAIMDIAAAQWHLQWLGKLSRVDLRLVDGVDTRTWLATLQSQEMVADNGLRLERPDRARQRMSNLSRAYRVNLNVLALVALLTGGFIVFATLDLAVMRLIPTLSLVAIIGAPSGLALRLVLILSLCLGVIGALLGLALGIALAWSLLGLVGGDLGGGFFSTQRPALSVAAGSLILFFLLGIGAALAGGLSPALRMKRLSPSQALKSGATLRPDTGFSARWLSPLLFILGAGLLWLPALDGLPVGAYLAIACWLFSGVLIVSPLLGVLARRLSNWSVVQSKPLLMLAINRLRQAHQRAFPALAGVVASFALLCAMAIMVHSFRVSVDQWLETVLPATIYARVPSSGARAAFTSEDQQRLATIPGIEQIDFVRSVDLIIDPDEPAVELIARTIDKSNPDASLPLTGNQLDSADSIPDCQLIYASEPAASKYKWQVADQLSLPLASSQNCFQVAGIWRDYARQSGAIVINRSNYAQLTSDDSVSGASIWVSPTADTAEVVELIRQELDSLPGLQIRSAEAIRALSLRIFDRSFAVTYALEAVALLVSLFGVATTYSGEALARIKEFGMLRHLGVNRRKLAALFVCESTFCISLGVITGALLGAAISQVLIHRVNPQSFNWTMQTHWPWGQLTGAAALLVLLGALTATLAARKASGRAPIEAVRSDW